MRFFKLPGIATLTCTDAGAIESSLSANRRVGDETPNALSGASRSNQAGLFRQASPDDAASSALIFLHRIGAELVDHIDDSIVVEPEPAKNATQECRKPGHIGHAIFIKRISFYTNRHINAESVLQRAGWFSGSASGRRRSGRGFLAGNPLVHGPCLEVNRRVAGARRGREYRRSYG